MHTIRYAVVLTLTAAALALTGCGTAVNYRDRDVQFKQEASDRTFASGKTYSVAITGAPIDPARIAIKGPSRASGVGDVVITLDIASQASMAVEQHTFDGVIKVPKRYEDSGKAIAGQYHTEQVAFQIHWATGEIRRPAKLSVAGPRSMQHDVGISEPFTVGKANQEPAVISRLVAANTGSTSFADLEQRDAGIQHDEFERLRREYLVDTQGALRFHGVVLPTGGAAQTVAARVAALRAGMDAQTLEQILAKANALLESTYGFGSRTIAVPFAAIDGQPAVGLAAEAAADPGRIEAAVKELERLGGMAMELEGRERAAALYNAAALRFVQARHEDAVALLTKAYALSYNDGDGFFASLGLTTAHGAILNQRILDLERRIKDLMQRDAGAAKDAATKPVEPVEPSAAEQEPAASGPRPAARSSVGAPGQRQQLPGATAPAVVSQPSSVAQPAIAQPGQSAVVASGQNLPGSAQPTSTPRKRAVVQAEMQQLLQQMMDPKVAQDPAEHARMQERYLALINEFAQTKE